MSSRLPVPHACVPAAVNIKPSWGCGRFGLAKVRRRRGGVEVRAHTPQYAPPLSIAAISFAEIAGRPKAAGKSKYVLPPAFDGAMRSKNALKSPPANAGAAPAAAAAAFLGGETAAAGVGSRLPYLNLIEGTRPPAADA